MALRCVISTTDVARQLGPNIFDPGTRSPEQIVATNGATVAWRRPLANMFPSPGYSTDTGWDFDRIPAVGLFVGSVGGPSVSATANQSVDDLSRAATAGFRMSDGTTIWRNPGTQYVCGVLPCPGMTQTSSGNSAYRPPTLGLRLRMTGTSTLASSPGAKPSLSPGAKVVVEGFDLATGRTTWSVDAGADVGLAQGLVPPQLGQEVVILPGAGGGPASLDLTTGSRAPLSPGVTAWCQTTTTYTGAPYDNGTGGTGTDYGGAPAEFPCNSAGQPVPVPSQVPSFVGPSLGGVVAWSESTQVTASRAGA